MKESHLQCLCSGVLISSGVEPSQPLPFEDEECNVDLREQTSFFCMQNACPFKEKVMLLKRGL